MPKKKHYESILNIENHDEVMTVNTGDSRTEGANEIISFPFEKWLTKVDSNANFSPASLKTIQCDCSSVTQQISIENFQTSKHYAYEIKAKRMLCINPEAQNCFALLLRAFEDFSLFLSITFSDAAGI